MITSLKWISPKLHRLVMLCLQESDNYSRKAEYQIFSEKISQWEMEHFLELSSGVLHLLRTSINGFIPGDFKSIQICALLIHLHYSTFMQK